MLSDVVIATLIHNYYYFIAAYSDKALTKALMFKYVIS